MPRQACRVFPTLSSRSTKSPGRTRPQQRSPLLCWRLRKVHRARRFEKAMCSNPSKVGMGMTGKRGIGLLHANYLPDNRASSLATKSDGGGKTLSILAWPGSSCAKYIPQTAPIPKRLIFCWETWSARSDRARTRQILAREVYIPPPAWLPAPGHWSTRSLSRRALGCWRRMCSAWRCCAGTERCGVAAELTQDADLP